MNKFQEIYKKLLEKELTNNTIKINSREKTIKGMVRLTSKHYLEENGEYIKIIFMDGSFLLAVKNDEEFYYADSIVEHIKSISDNAIGKETTLFYNDKEYELANKDDYQYVLDLLIGTPLDIEGECRFSDYSPKEGTKEFLSLGWMSETGKRADINPIFIDTNKIEL